MSTLASRTRVVLGVLAIGLLGTTIAARAQEPPPLLTATVNDFAGMIDAGSARQLDTLIRALQRASGDVVIVATVNTVAPYADIREYAVKMFENRGQGIGQRGKDNGLLVLVARQEREVRIEVGYELEGYVTDGFSGETVRQYIAPDFRRGDYGPGLVRGVSHLVARIAEGRNVVLQGVPAEEQRGAEGSSARNLTIALIVLFLVLNALGRTRRRGSRGRWGRGPWSGWHSGAGPFGGPFGGGFGGFGGGGGGGFGGFGGGRSGGGGGGGSW